MSMLLLIELQSKVLITSQLFKMNSVCPMKYLIDMFHDALPIVSALKISSSGFLMVEEREKPIYFELLPARITFTEAAN
jgi:hypothetical protein